MIEVSGSGKSNSLFNLISQQPDIDNIYLYAKDPYEAKDQLLINKREITGLKHLNYLKAIIEWSNNMDDIYKKNWIVQYANKIRKILIVFDDINADTISNKKLNPIVTELFIRGRKLNISLVFIKQSYFGVLQNIRRNSTHFFIMNIRNKQELQQIEISHWSDIDFQYVLQNHFLF